MDFVCSQFKSLYPSTIKNIKLTYNQHTHHLDPHALACISHLCRESPEQADKKWFEVIQNCYITEESQLLCFLHLCRHSSFHLIDDYQNLNDDITYTTTDIYAASATCDFLGIEAQLCLNCGSANAEELAILTVADSLLESCICKDPLQLIVYHQIALKTNYQLALQHFDRFLHRNKVYLTQNELMNAVHRIYWEGSKHIGSTDGPTMEMISEKEKRLFEFIGWNLSGMELYGYIFRFRE
jgi:hypothetical protein